MLTPSRPPGVDAVLSSWESARSRPTHFSERASDLYFDPTKANFEVNFLRIICAHPHVEFDLYLPPHSIAFQAFVREVAPRAFEDMLKWRKHVQQTLEPLPNVRLHDFQGNAELVQAFENYFDIIHTAEAAHATVLAAIADGSSLATSRRIAEANEFLQREAVPTWTSRTAE